MELFRVQAERATERAEKAEQKIKSLELNLLHKEQENTSLMHRRNVLEFDLEDTRDKLKSSEAK